MKKIDKLILGSFFGPFLITFFVVVFILLTAFMLKYFDELVGKDLGAGVIAQFIFYFSINVTENAFPLAVLLSSLMTFGNLGVHSELTAIKSAGISLLRSMRPLFLVTCFLVIVGFFNNNYLIPKANLEAFSLLYDIKQKKPALDIKQGIFYNDIPNYSIKINQKFPDDETLKDIIIYEQAGNRGNKDIILADSGKMYNILDSRYLVLELFNGKKIQEESSRRKRGYRNEKMPNPYLRSTFTHFKIVINLSDFDLKRTRKELFSSNRLMKNINQLRSDLDSMYEDYLKSKVHIYYNTQNMFKYHVRDLAKKRLTIADSINSLFNKKDSISRHIAAREELARNSDLVRDSAVERSKEKQKDKNGSLSQNYVGNVDSIRKIMLDSSMIKKNRVAPKPVTGSSKLQQANIDNIKTKIKNNRQVNSSVDIDSTRNVTRNQALKNKADSLKSPVEVIDSLFNTDRFVTTSVSKAVNHVRYVKGSLVTHNSQMSDKIKLIRKFEIERYKKLAKALTIMAMFLIGAPLGAIIKKGGLGFPVLLSVLFFVLFYVMSLLGEKWARQGLMDEFWGDWLPNLVLFPIGFFFLYQARRDAKLFDSDYYRTMWKRSKSGFIKLIRGNN